MVGLDFLEKVEVFKGLNDGQLAAVQSCCEDLEFQRGAKIFGTGDDAEYPWIVMEGKVDLRFDLPEHPTSEENTIASMAAGDLVGWSSMVPPYKYRLAAYCAARVCKMIRLGKTSLTQLLEKDANLGYKVMTNMATIMGKRFLRLQDEIANRRGEDIMSNWKW